MHTLRQNDFAFCSFQHLKLKCSARSQIRYILIPKHRWRFSMFTHQNNVLRFRKFLAYFKQNSCVSIPKMTQMNCINSAKLQCISSEYFTSKEPFTYRHHDILTLELIEKQAQVSLSSRYFFRALFLTTEADGGKNNPQKGSIQLIWSNPSVWSPKDQINFVLFALFQSQNLHCEGAH